MNQNGHACHAFETSAQTSRSRVGELSGWRACDRSQSSVASRAGARCVSRAMEAVAKHDFTANANDELSFRRNQILKVRPLRATNRSRARPRQRRPPGRHACRRALRPVPHSFRNPRANPVRNVYRDCSGSD